MIPVGRLAPLKQWDCNVFELLVSNRLYPTGLEFRSWAGYPGYPHAEGCVLQVPGRYWHQHTDQINESIAVYRWVLLVRTSDEEDLFDISEIVHPNVRFWVQTPRVGRDYGDARLFGVGYPPHFNDLPKKTPRRHTDVFLSAQNTHARRGEAFAALAGMKCTQRVLPTKGFTEGCSPDEFAAAMMFSRVAPAPSGAVSPDSFRFWEALEAHAIPIADTVSPVDGVTEYWRRLFGYDTPFPILRDYKHLPEIVDGLVEGWPANANRVAAWWCRQKRQYSHWLKEDLKELGALR